MPAVNTRIWRQSFSVYSVKIASFRVGGISIALCTVTLNERFQSLGHKTTSRRREVVTKVKWISEIATAWPPVWTTSRVLTVQCVANTMFLTLERVFGRIKSLSVYRSTSKSTGSFFHEHFVPPQEESPRLSALARYSVQSKHRACLSTSRSQVYQRSNSCRKSFLRSYPIRGVTPRDLTWWLWCSIHNHIPFL